MRLSELPRTTSFRLALLFLLLFGAASLTLFGVLYWQTKDFMRDRVIAWLTTEQQGVASMSQAQLLDRLAAHVVFDTVMERPFTLYDATGRLEAGSPLDLPASQVVELPREHSFMFTAQRGGRETQFRGLIHQLPTGELMLIAKDTTEIHAFGDVLIWSFFWGALITALLGLAGALIAGADAVHRIDGVTRAAQRIVRGDLSGRLPTRGRSGDFDRLVLVINGMLGEIEHLMQEVKGVCDNIAHDLRTPLTRLLAGLERASRRARSADDYAAAVDEAIQETRGVLKTFAALLRISEVESGARRAGFTTVDLPTVAADVVELYEPMAEEKSVALRLASCGGSVSLMPGDPSLLFEAVGNLVENAIKFTPSGGTVTVRTFTDSDRPGIEVADTGPGIPAAEREAVMRRFYRSEASRHTPGSGLGLTLVAAVARLHEMTLTVADAAPGCRITLSARFAERPLETVQASG